MEVKTKETIINEIKSSNQRAIEWFNTIPVDQFFIRNGEVWSASDNVDHLIKAVKPIALALKMPRFGLQTMFGKAEHPSRTYDEICKTYADEISKGAQASGRFLPNQESPVQPEQQKKELLDQLVKANNSLLSALEKWQDLELDEYQLPHPIVGKLTIREMLFFSIYHTLRHARIEGD
ncbi:MAG: DinB family protein [Anaerolineales bacterium]|nr:DinB family protein [Anaerolineales bacterium]